MIRLIHTQRIFLAISSPSIMSFTFNGREYNVDDWLREAISLEELLAKNLKLLDPLPADTDLTDADEKEIQSQVRKMLDLDSVHHFSTLLYVIPDKCDAHLVSICHTRLLECIRSSSPGPTRNIPSQSLSHNAASCLFDPPPSSFSPPRPKNRTILSQVPPIACADLPTIVADGFVQGIQWKRPSGPGQICCLIIHFLFWGNSTKGDDGKASINADVRTKLAERLGSLIGTPQFEQLPQIQRVDIERLHGILKAIQGMPEDYYLRSTRSYLEGQLDECGRTSCDEEAVLACSKCKSVKYCGKKCQTWHWKNGHKLRCSQVA